MGHVEQSPWICHVCERRFTEGEPDACSVCYKITCSQHLKHVPVEKDSGLLVLEPICTYCELMKTV